MNKPIILASGSPRRKDLLTDAMVAFEVLTSNVDESVISGETPEDMVKRLSFLKADHIAKFNKDRWVLGADTTVVIDDKILCKPEDQEDAFKMLSQLQGRTHSVWTAFCLLNIAASINYIEALETKVTMVSMSDEEIRRYVATGEPMDKAGSYAIQGVGASIVSRISGSYTNVVGLPIPETIVALRKFGVIQ